MNELVAAYAAGVQAHVAMALGEWKRNANDYDQHMHEARVYCERLDVLIRAAERRSK